MKIRQNVKESVMLGLVLVLLVFASIGGIYAMDKSGRGTRVLEITKIDTSANHGKIAIDGNAQLASFPNKTGAGILGNPYTIKDLIINASGSGSAIDIRNTDAYLLIQNCTVFNSGSIGREAGIHLENCTNVIMSGNHAFSNKHGFSLEYSNHNTALGNNASNNTENGITLYYCYDNTVSGNNASGNVACGIYGYGSNNTIVSGNKFIYNNYGINIYHGSYNNSASGNTVSRNTYGIALDGFKNKAMGNNASKNNVIGIVISGPENSVSGNTVSNNTCGICLTWSSNNTISGNTAANNTWYGILLETSSNNTVFSNLFTGNQVSQANRTGGTGNKWDDGSLGNYWGDYTSRYPAATNNSVIWNTPYTINGGGQDNFPLVVNPMIDVFPVANFIAGVTRITVGQSIVFTYTGTAGNGIASYQWDFGDGSANATVKDPVHQYTSPGTFRVTRTVVDKDGDSNTISRLDFVTVINVETNIPGYPLHVLAAFTIVAIGIIVKLKMRHA